VSATRFTRSGVLLIDKPSGMTSHDVVARVRKSAGTRKVGHAGTLDPMATGLLLIGVNSSTRLLTFLVGLDKEYFATIRLGQSTDSDDADGAVIATAPASAVVRVDDRTIARALAAFVGTLEQVPSSVSAIKVNGRRAYDLARAGEPVTLPARTVTINDIAVLDVRRDGPSGFIDVDVRIECSSGTYVRAIARDLGVELETGGHLTALRRSKVGPFDVGHAAALDDIDVARSLLAPVDVATTLFARRDLEASEAIDLVHGKLIPAGPVERTRGPIAAVSPTGVLVGLVELRGDVLKPLVNFPTDETAPDEIPPDEVSG
jgi:tRNA pseudouridine55 synthase